VSSVLANVKHILIVLSGKGGVGKSTFSAQLAWFLAHQRFEVSAFLGFNCFDLFIVCCFVVSVTHKHWVVIVCVCVYVCVYVLDCACVCVGVCVYVVYDGLLLVFPIPCSRIQCSFCFICHMMIRCVCVYVLSNITNTHTHTHTHIHTHTHTHTRTHTYIHTYTHTLFN